MIGQSYRKYIRLFVLVFHRFLSFEFHFTEAENKSNGNSSKKFDPKIEIMFVCVCVCVKMKFFSHFIIQLMICVSVVVVLLLIFLPKLIRMMWFFFLFLCSVHLSIHYIHRHSLWTFFFLHFFSHTNKLNVVNHLDDKIMRSVSQSFS